MAHSCFAKALTLESLTLAAEIDEKTVADPIHAS
jgi:hypothetical protein